MLTFQSKKQTTMKKLLYILSFSALLGSCTSDSEFLDREPTNILGQEETFNRPDLVLSVLADLYNRYYDFGTVEDWS
ncbi:MAG TPA: RagB/SusD family nutrient uptake outer membrane protein, partial [Zunongwangia profunda]|nr:RagB/SusD family nutrient uptake outer membrane protein [Zunongwangia profunda]